MTTAVMALGGAGVISVAANADPVRVNAMTMAALDGDFDTAASLQIQLHPLIKALFTQVNPIPIKASMQLLGYDCGNCRLPLTMASVDLQQALAELIKKIPPV